MATVTPWWKTLQIRDEILDASGQIDDVQMSLYRAVYGTGATQALYSDTTYYGSITHPAERLVDLLAEVAIRLGGGSSYERARAVTRLDQGMGGGKSHACIGAFHLAANPKALFQTELGRAVLSASSSRLGRELPVDLDGPHVVVLPCDSMTPFAPVDALDGPATTFYERFLWRLFSKDYSLYDRYKSFWSDKSKIAEALRAVNKPILIIVDEILDYVGNGLEGAGRPDLVAQDMAFIRALLDAVNDVPNVSMLVVLIASDRDRTALTVEGQARRDDLNSLLDRNGQASVVTEVADFADILRRRLFDTEPPTEVIEATAALYAGTHLDKAWVKGVWDPIGSKWRRDWIEQVSRCYPFHPMLIGIAADEWSLVTGFQKVRSTIRIFAATVYAQQQRGVRGEWVPTLIGPGDLPLSENAVREALLSAGLVEDDKTIANYRSIAENEIVNSARTAGLARLQDINRGPLMWSEVNPYAAERAATYIFLASIVGNHRPGRGKGASAPEVRAATSVPDTLYSLTEADLVVDELVNQEHGMKAVDVVAGQGNNKPARYFLSTRNTYTMLVQNIMRTVTESERDQVIMNFTKRLANSGPFREILYVSADIKRSPSDVLTTAGLDTAHCNRLVVLDPAQFSLRNGLEASTIEALTAATGLGSGTGKLPIQWASSAIYSVVNTQRRALVRRIAVEYLARQKALAEPEVQNDDELKATGAKEVASAKEKFEKRLKQAYQHVVYLAQPDPDGDRVLAQETFDADNLTALDGTMVWKALVEGSKAFDAGQFTSKALVHNLRDSDYGRSLADIRSSFYNAPRLPLLFGGDIDLARAIFDAVDGGFLRIIDSTGESVAVTGSNQVNLSSASLRLAKPAEEQHPQEDGEPSGEGTGGDGAGQGQKTSAGTARASTRGGKETEDGGVDDTHPEESKDQQIAISFTRNLLGDIPTSEAFSEFFRALYLACDENQIAYLQATLQVLVRGDAAKEIVAKAKELDVDVSVRDV